MSQSPAAQLQPLLYHDIVRAALREDLGRGGDITTDAIVAPDLHAAARIVARSAARICGIEIAASVFTQLAPSTEAALRHSDGSDAPAGATLAVVRGPARALLSGERVALNLLGRLSGIATLTRSFVEAVSGTRARVVCTRKTTPGLRVLEKYAVRCGGGANHRFGLDDAVLIKDNHVVLAGGVRPALERARAAVGHTVKIEVEVDTLQQLEEALQVGCDAVLLDNMTPPQLREAVAMVGNRAITEASGGISLESAAAVAATGVDLLSVGALTHSVACLDVSLEMDAKQP